MSLPVFVLTIFVPPWLEVHCQRRQILYWSERVKVHDRSFAGFDYLLASQKWSHTTTPPNPSSDTYFESREFTLWWPLLIAEWMMVLVAAGACYFRLSRRVFQLPGKAKPQFAEQSHAPEPGAGQVSIGESPPSAR